MQFTKADSLSFAPKGMKKGTMRKRTWMNDLKVGEAKTYRSESPTILRRLRNQVYRFNKLNGKRLSVRSLSNGGFAVIREA